MIFEQKRLDELGTIITGKTPSTKNEEFWDGEIPFVTPKDIQGTKHIFETERYITHKGLNSVKGARLPIGAICVSCIGNIGYLGITMHECVSNQQINSLIVNGDNDKDYVYYLLKSMWPYFKNYEGQSTTLSILNKTQFSKIIVEVPSLPNQKKIASILSKIDDKIELNNKINNNLEQQVSVLYHSWFEDFEITNGICPDNWNYQELSSIADIASGKRPPIKSDICNQETPVAIVGAASVMGFTSEANHKDKILVTGRVGTHGIIQRFNTPCWTSDNTLVITSPFYEFTNQILHRIDYSSMNRGSTQPLITQGDMKKVIVLVPDDDTLAKFEEFAGSLMAKWEANNKENIKLASLRDALLPKLMSGELDVSDINL